MIWLRVAAHFVGVVAGFAFLGLCMGTCAGGLHALILFPFFEQIFLSVRGSSTGTFLDHNAKLGWIGYGPLAGAVTGTLVMGLVGVFQGVFPPQTKYNKGPYTPLFGMILGGWVFLTVSFLSGTGLVTYWELPRGKSPFLDALWHALAGSRGLRFLLFRIAAGRLRAGIFKPLVTARWRQKAVIWLRILCDAIGRMIWFSLGGLLCGCIGGVACGIIFVPLCAVLVGFLSGPATAVSVKMLLLDGLYTGVIVGGLTGAATGISVMAIVGLVQGFTPHKLSLDTSFNRHFGGMFCAGIWCLLAGFFSGSLFGLVVALAQGDTFLNSAFFGSGAFGLWLLICYFGGSLFGALAPDTLGKFWRRIKAVLSHKPKSAEE